MPDLTIVIMQQCGSSDHFSIGGYSQYNVRGYDASCSCKGFKFRKKCKHLDEAKKLVCHYHEQIHGAPKKKGICPHCGHKTEYVKVGV